MKIYDKTISCQPCHFIIFYKLWDDVYSSYSPKENILIMKIGIRNYWAVIIAVSLIASSVHAGGLYLYELGTPVVGFASAGWAIMGNLGWQEWSEFGKVGVVVTSEDTNSLTIDRDYKDTWHAAVGAQYRVAAPLLLTAGIAYDSSMVDDEDRTLDLPMGESWRFGLGSRCDSICLRL